MHGMLICPRSHFFEAVVNGPFKVSLPQVITNMAGSKITGRSDQGRGAA